MRDKDYLIQQQADEIERLRRDVKKQQEKMFGLAKDFRSWMSVEDPPKKSCKVIVRCVCNSTGETDVTTAYYRERYQRFHMTGNRSHWRVTHWIWPWSEPAVITALARATYHVLAYAVRIIDRQGKEKR